MQFNHTKTAAAVLWVLAMGAIGLAIGVTSVTGWTIVAVLALVPPFVVRRLLKDEASISESIHEALR